MTVPALADETGGERLESEPAEDRCRVCSRLLDGAALACGPLYCSRDCASSGILIPGRYLG